MAWRPAFLCAPLLCGLLGACTLPHQDVAVDGNADGVIIRYAGNISETEPLARQHCARYERVPVFWQSKENTAVYRCIKPGTS